jgi:hypothetical protein
LVTAGAGPVVLETTIRYLKERVAGLLDRSTRRLVDAPAVRLRDLATDPSWLGL